MSLMANWYNLIIALLVYCLENKSELAISKFIRIDTSLQFNIWKYSNIFLKQIV